MNQTMRPPESIIIQHNNEENNRNLTDEPVLQNNDIKQ